MCKLYSLCSSFSWAWRCLALTFFSILFNYDSAQKCSLWAEYVFCSFYLNSYRSVTCGRYQCSILILLNVKTQSKCWKCSKGKSLKLQNKYISQTFIFRTTRYFSFHDGWRCIQFVALPGTPNHNFKFSYLQALL